ncbi:MULTISPECIES: hypothetical protein [unclassified Crossiella]|nr:MULTISPECIES: hypothetical protein [unclassified Crossiella]
MNIFAGATDLAGTTEYLAAAETPRACTQPIRAELVGGSHW